MFYCEEKVGEIGKVFDSNGSTCVKHEFAMNYIDGPDSPLSIWDNDDLTRLIVSSHSTTFDGQNESNLRSMISEVLQCKFGKPIPMGIYGMGFNLTSTKGASVQIPAFDFDDLNDRDGVIGEFVSTSGLDFFQWVKVEKDASDQVVMSSD